MTDMRRKGSAAIAWRRGTRPCVTSRSWKAGMSVVILAGRWRKCDAGRRVHDNHMGSPGRMPPGDSSFAPAGDPGNAGRTLPTSWMPETRPASRYSKASQPASLWELASVRSTSSWDKKQWPRTWRSENRAPGDLYRLTSIRMGWLRWGSQAVMSALKDSVVAMSAANLLRSVRWRNVNVSPVAICITSLPIVLALVVVLRGTYLTRRSVPVSQHAVASWRDMRRSGRARPPERRLEGAIRTAAVLSTEPGCG